MNTLKTILTLILLNLCVIGTLHAQQQQPASPCGTKQLSESQMRWLRDYQQRQTPYSLNSRGGQFEYLPLHFHVVGTNNGSGYYTVSEIFRLLCDLNEQYTPLGIQFYLHDEPTYINNSSYYDHDWAAGAQMMQNYNIDGVINLYMVSSPAGNCGYYSPWNDALSVANSCAGDNSTTLAHELGHYFSMPHTFSGWEDYFEPNGVQNGEPSNNQQERANGSNCNSAGDGFCDTPADYLSYRWNCPYNRDFTDPLGLLINPDGQNYMSYSNDGCQRYFSAEQIEAIRANIFEERSYLLNNSSGISTVLPEETVVLYPIPNAQNIPADNALVAWRRSPHATSYFLEIRQASTSGINIQTFTTDTSIIAQLTPDKTYFVSVVPITNGNTCAPVASTYFKTTSNDVLYINSLSIQTLACHDDTNAALTLSAAGGTEPYTYTWSNGAVGPNLSNLGNGLYNCTISDALANSNVIPIVIYEPAALNLKATQIDNGKVQLTCTGGTQPYTYTWFNGAQGNLIENLTGDSYSAIITDARGCTDTVGAALLSYTASVTSLLCHGANNGSVSVEVGGGVPPYTYDWVGMPDSTPAISNLERDVYDLKVTDSAGNKATFSFLVEEPALLQTNVNFSGGNSAVASVAGGVSPYTYLWSNNSTMPSTSGLSPTWFSVTVTDSNGCTVIDQEGISGIEQAPDGDFSVYPTILTAGNSQIQIQIRVGEVLPVNVNIVGINGQLLQQTSHTLQAGFNTFEADAGNLPNGIYLLQIESKNGFLVQKFSVVGK